MSFPDQYEILGWLQQRQRESKLYAVGAKGRCEGVEDMWEWCVFQNGARFRVSLIFNLDLPDGRSVCLQFSAKPPEHSDHPRRSGTVLLLEVLTKHEQEQEEDTIPECALLLADSPALDAPHLRFRLWLAGDGPNMFLMVNPDKNWDQTITDTFRFGYDAEDLIFSHLAEHQLSFNINVPDRFGVPPLVYACALGSPRMIRMLLDYKGTNAKITRSTNSSALQAMVRRTVVETGTDTEIESDIDLENAFMRLVHHSSLENAAPDHEAYFEAVEQASCGPLASLRYVDILSPRHKVLTAELLLTAVPNPHLLERLLPEAMHGPH